MRPVPTGSTGRTAAIVTWRRCANHPQMRSEQVCPACEKGFCRACAKPVASAFGCPICDGLCISSALREQAEVLARQRARPMSTEIGTIAGYPMIDPVAFVILSVVVWIFATAAKFAAFGGGLAILFSQGLLMAYAFTAVNRVAGGNLKSYLPQISDASDLVAPLRLGFAALLISTGPLLLVLFLYPAATLFGYSLGDAQPPADVVHAQEVQQPVPVEPVESEPTPPEEGDPEAPQEIDPTGSLEGLPGTEEPFEPSGPPSYVWLLIALALLWNLVYSPIALTVAAISRSFLTTLNPLVGIDSIRTMGSAYWQAMGIYTVLALIQLGAAAALAFVPFVGGLIRAFVDSYLYLCIGCTLGLAVFKKAPELGLD